MKLAYEAANSLEAHMIVNLLEQQGVRAEINGAFLQGAMGELPAAGMIRVMVDDEDHVRAKAIVQGMGRGAAGSACGCGNGVGQRAWRARFFCAHRRRGRVDHRHGHHVGALQNAGTDTGN